MTCNKCREEEEHTNCPNATPGTTVVFKKGERIALEPGDWIDDKPDADLDEFPALLEKYLNPPKE